MTLKVDIAYVVQSTDGRSVKVGVSSNPKSRLASIRQGLPFDVKLVALLEDGRASEKEMKSLLVPWKLQGEWFEPRPELNDFLAAKRRENKLLHAAKVDAEYCDLFIKPLVVEYLSGRQPLFNYAGDLVYRYLREGFPVVAGRMDELHSALKREVSASILAGFIPLPHDQITPAVSLPALSHAVAVS